MSVGNIEQEVKLDFAKAHGVDGAFFKNPDLTFAVKLKKADFVDISRYLISLAILKQTCINFSLMPRVIECPAECKVERIMAELRRRRAKILPK